jgi:sterol desaturase/sphingolipid hydroxylase (fatty acid hydroxylase superfamily)
LLVFEPVIGAVYTAAFVAMYVTYEIVHRRAHTHAGIGAYGRFLRRHHVHHHFGNPKANHGVTSPAWDFVFGTFESPSVIRVPEKLAMRWLVDEQTGGVRSMFSDVYTLVPRRGSA